MPDTEIDIIFPDPIITDVVIDKLGPAGVGVPAGGTTGQRLAKTSNTSFDTQWVDPAVGSTSWGDILGVLANQVDLQNALNAKDAVLTFSDSVSRSVNTITLKNDSAAPGASKYYGTDGTSTFGYFALPSGASPANPTATVSGSAVNGVAATFMRSDAAPALANTAVTAGSYGDASHVPGYTVDAQGRLTAASSTAISITASAAGLGNVTNDTQTKAAVVPNTAPGAGQILVGNAGGTAYAPTTLSGSGATATLSSAGVLTLSAIPNATLSNSAITIAGTATSLGGSISLDTISGVSGNGFLKRTGVNTWTNDTSTYLTGNQTITLSGEVTGSGATAITTAIDRTIAPTWTGQHIWKFDGLGDAKDDTKGVLLENTTAAAVSAQQWSPEIQWIGQGWTTNIGGASKTVTSRAYLVPVQGASNPTGYVTFVGTNGTGGTVTDNLNIFTGGGISVGSAPSNMGAGIINANSGFRIGGATPTDGHYLRGNGTNFVDNTIQAGDVPTLNQDTTGSAASLKSNATTGVMQIVGPAAASTRVKTVSNADDTILELAGNYTPTGTWTSMKLATTVVTGGTGGAPGLAFSAGTDCGFYCLNSAFIGVSLHHTSGTNENKAFAFGTNSTHPVLNCASDSYLTWTSTNAEAGSDTGFSRDSAGILAFGTGTQGSTAGKWKATNGILIGVLISALPGTPAAGTQAYVTDGDAGLAWGATAVNTGSGATKYLVWYNGTNWAVVGK